ncbi:class I SAM-dependent methyltransferase [Paenibacillus aceti]|uniref:Methyltransferase type 11 domain-containing protein n=1 Tax=Paenibacillus aceti TaxID=1820010 RepID=A0ABQ1W2H9_9BACL|nr:class I SAM-dependent methyltransferase [Paenibacillus aceti]GGG08239.1 hypothetical protein GCM10010913_32480 [Paenibacillus aceti]
MTKIDASFDQFQRYNNVKRIIDNLRMGNETFHILEVGANEHRNLEKFLPLDNITYLDIQLPEELLNDPKYILGDATKMDFPDNYYDVIVALDVFEHIPEQKRNQFIDELYRVSSQLCVITAPFYSSQTVAAESRVNTVYKSLFNKNFIWLEEHMDNGLPNKDILKSYLSSKNIKYKIFGHGDISIWERLMSIHFFAAKNPGLASYRQEIDKFYNSQLFDNDYTEDSYRQIVIIEKSRKCPRLEISDSKISESVLEKLNILEKIFYNLLSMVNRNDKENGNDKVQIFVDTGRGFNEPQSESYQYNDEESSMHIATSLVNYENVQAIRIDPSNYHGLYKIEILKLNNVNKEKVTQYQISGNYSFEDSSIFMFEKNDPNIVLSINGKVNVSELEITVSKLSMSEIAYRFVNILSNKENEINSINTKYSEQLAENISIKNEIENNRLLTENLETERQELIDKLLSKEKELNEVIYNIKNENNELNKKLTLKEKELIESLSKENHLQISTDKVRNENIELNNRICAMEEELKGIYESKAWALIVKLRKILGK